MAGIDYFVSCVTGTQSHSSKTNKTIRPGVAYFISYINNTETNEEKIFKKFHDIELDCYMTTIKNKLDGVEATLNLLKQVVKDHNSAFAKNMVLKSLEHCSLLYLNRQTENTPVTNVDIEAIKKLNKMPCRMVIVNEVYRAPLELACSNLRKDGMFIDCTTSTLKVNSAPLNIEPTTGIGKSLKVMKAILKRMDHGLFRGEIYRLAPKGQYAYIYMCSVDCYLQQLISIGALQDELIINLNGLKNILIHHDCCVIPQLKFNYDLIEVPGGKCFKLSSRNFISSPFTASQKGFVSPRCFHDYTIENAGIDGGPFATSIVNSFPETFDRINFLNKLYQVCLYKQLPIKTKKLVACGPSDSGKTSWAQLFFGLFGEHKVASIAKEKAFALSMIQETTEVIFIDEWSDDLLKADVAKTVLQGGLTVQSRK